MSVRVIINPNKDKKENKIIEKTFSSFSEINEYKNLHNIELLNFRKNNNNTYSVIFKNKD